MSHNAWLQRLKAATLDAFAPCHCAVCSLPSGRPIELCAACQAELPWMGPACLQCALPLVGDQVICGQCLKREPAFDTVIAACLFEQPVSGFVHGFKYHGQFALLRLLGELLAEAVAERLVIAEPPDYVLPMPLHWARRWQRGFNQAALLAREIRKHPLLEGYDLPVDTRLCRRRRATPPQRGADAGTRRRNLRNAMVAGAELQGETVAVVDDVLTTGASAEAVASCLKAAGAGRVEIWCCARTPAPSQQGGRRAGATMR